MSKTRIVAIDYGAKRVGLAISDAGQNIALPWKTVPGDFQSVVTTLKSREGEIQKILIGLPLLMNGTKGDMANIVEAFAKKLELALSIPVILLDERLSSKHADTILRETGQNRRQRSEKLDATAATLLLQSHLDH